MSIINLASKQARRYLTPLMNVMMKNPVLKYVKISMNYANGILLSMVIHGLDEENEDDDESIKKLFSIVEMDAGQTTSHRLGVRRKDGVRPIRIFMESKGKKAELMSNLWKLKYAENAFKKIRVTDDHTWQERREIRRWVSMAEERNKNEGRNGNTNLMWKVRGTPRWFRFAYKITNTDEERMNGRWKQAMRKRRKMKNAR